jgi:hypothetical protein
VYSVWTTPSTPVNELGVDKQTATLEAEKQRLDRQNKCNEQWQTYDNAKLEKRIAELRGQIGKTPLESLSAPVMLLGLTKQWL